MSHKMTRRGLIAGSIVGAVGFVGLEERLNERKEIQGFASSPLINLPNLS